MILRETSGVGHGLDVVADQTWGSTNGLWGFAFDWTSGTGSCREDPSDPSKDNEAIALMAEMIRFLADGAAFTPGKVVQCWRLPTPLAPPAPPETSGTCVTGITRVIVIEAIARWRVPLLSFADFAGRMSVLDGCFKLAVAHDPETSAGKLPFFSVTFGHMPKTLAAAYAFLFFGTSTKMGTRQGP
jgi:hypothetical protein